MSNLLLSLCALALICTTGDVSKKGVSPFPTGFSFAGFWNCSGTFRGGKLHKATFSGSAAIGGKWLALTEVDIEPATGYEATYLIGDDETKGGLVEFDANTFDAAIYRSSQGWQADTLIMAAPESASPEHSYVTDRFVYTVTLKSGFTVEWQTKREHKGPWLTADQLHCEAATSA